jgi:hypothetical protein
VLLNTRRIRFRRSGDPPGPPERRDA